jgi:hypothetical protein
MVLCGYRSCSLTGLCFWNLSLCTAKSFSRTDLCFWNWSLCTARSFSRTDCFWNWSLCTARSSLEQVCDSRPDFCLQLEVPLEQVCVSGTGLCVQLEVLSNRSVFLELILFKARSSSRTDLCFRNFFFNYLLELRALLHFRVFFTKNMIQKDNEDDDIEFYFLIDPK